MIPKFRFFNIKLNKIFNVINIDLFNEQVDCVLDKLYEDVITWDIKDGVLMQYTGLTDKDGIEMFEGDILKVAYDDIYGETNVCDVVAKNPFDYSLTEANWLNHAYQIEVIGNIHEHSDLLK